MKLLSTAALALLAPVLVAPIVRADVFLTRNVHVDATTNANGEALPARDEVQSTWIGKDKVRTESGGLTYIVRLDQKKLYIVRNDGTHSVLDLPVDVTRYVKPEERRAYDAFAETVHVTATVQASDETERINGWGAKKYVMQVRYPAGGSVDTLWTTKDIEMDTTTYWEAVRAVYGLRPGGTALVDELKKTEGITVKAERLRTVGTNRVRTTEELASVERKEAPAGTYDVPSTSKEVPFNALPYLRRMLGPIARPADGAQPADASSGRRGKDEEKPAPVPADGEKRKRGGGGG